MSARILPFPARGPFRVLVGFSHDDGAWLEYGRLHENRQDAIADAYEVARGSVPPGGS